MEDVMALSIPIIAIVMGIGTGALALLLDYRKKRDIFALHHKERLAAIEKGMEVPPLPPEFFMDNRRRQREPQDYLRRGLVFLLVGISVAWALYETERQSYVWGLVPAAIGIAQLVFYAFISRKGQQGQPGQG